MFSWLKRILGIGDRKPSGVPLTRADQSHRNGPPPLLKANEGLGLNGQVAFSNNSKGSWTEKFDVMESLVKALRKAEFEFRKHRTWIETSHGFILQPQLASFQPLDDGGSRTVTTIQVNHPLLVPAGLFEFQHSAGDSIEASLAQGFDRWIELDLPVLIDALRPDPKVCGAIEFPFEAEFGQPEQKRRALLGPVSYFAQNMTEVPEGGHQPFCSCCLLTHSLEAFEKHVRGDGVY